MRYLTNQYHKLTCGPVAYANALKDIGIPMTYKYSVSLFPWSVENGTNNISITNQLKVDNIRHKVIKPTFDKIQREIDKGRGVILLYKWCGCNSGHFIYINGYSKKHFTGYNYRPKTSLIRKIDLAKDIRHSYKNYVEYYPKAIVILEEK